MPMDWSNKIGSKTIIEDSLSNNYPKKIIVDLRTLFLRPRRTMDSIRVSEAPDTGSIPVEATKLPGEEPTKGK